MGQNNTMGQWEGASVISHLHTKFSELSGLMNDKKDSFTYVELRRTYRYYNLSLQTVRYHFLVPRILLRGVWILKYGCFFLEKFQMAFDPPSPSPFLEISLRFFAKIRKYALTCVNVQ